MANIRSLLKSFVGKPEGIVGVRGEREMPFEKIIPSPDGTKRFLFRAWNNGEDEVLTIALQAKNSSGGWAAAYV